MAKEKKEAPALRSFLAGLMLAITGCLCVFLVLHTQKTTASLIEANEKAKMSFKVIGNVLPPKALPSNAKVQCHLLSGKPYGKGSMIYVTRVNNAVTGYVVIYNSDRGYAEELKLITGFDANKKVYKADILSSNETPGIGDKVFRPNSEFLDKLAGFGLEDKKWDVKKYRGDFDFITGSTVTSRAIVRSNGDILKTLNDADIDSLPDCSGK